MEELNEQNAAWSREYSQQAGAAAPSFVETARNLIKDAFSKLGLAAGIERENLIGVRG